MANQLLLVRHGETEWARTGRHTGLTDVPLTSVGERQAVALAAVLAPRAPALVLTSPLLRARGTAQLAGFTNAIEEPLLLEWDYGAYEGLTTPDIRELTGHDWTVFADGVVAGATPGETLDQVADRARALLERLAAALDDGDVVLVGHGHALRVLAACWIGADPAMGASLLLDPGSVSVLGEQHDVRAIASWNVVPGIADEPGGKARLDAGAA